MSVMSRGHTGMGRQITECSRQDEIYKTYMGRRSKGHLLDVVDIRQMPDGRR